MLFDFLDCVADLKGKEIKRAALNELVESVATSRGVLIEPLYPEAIKMVRVEEGEGRLGGEMKCKASEHESMLITGTPGNSLHSKIIDKERRMNGWK